MPLLRYRRAGVPILLLTVLVGAIIGTVLGEALGEHVALFRNAASLGISPTEIHIGRFFTLHFGFSLRLNLATAIGLIIALLLFRSL